MKPEVKPWWKSRIHWSNFISTLLSILPFVLTYLEAAEIPAADKALWVLVVQIANAGLTSVFRNSTTAQIGKAPMGDNAEHA